MARLERCLAEKKRQRIKISLVLAGILFLVVAIAGASNYFRGTSKAKEAGSLMALQNKINIVVLGVDERNEDIGRSDTLFVVTADTNTKEVAMLSIPRDTRVKIPGNGWDKINHAYSLGGYTLTQKTVEDLLGIKIDHYVKININGFKKVIDAIGGIDIEVEKRMYYADPYDSDGGLVINLQPGMQHMDGQTAIQYVRYRDEEGDIGRVERQQKFLKAVLNEVTKPSVITKLPAIIKEISNVITTDISTTQMLSYVTILNDTAQNGLKTDMVPGKPGYINDISYWLPDIMALRQHVAQTLGITMDDKYAADTKQEIAEYETSIPKEMKVIDAAASQASGKSDKKVAAIAKQPVKPNVSKNDKIRIEVVNASGDPDAGGRLADVLRAQGFDVTSVVGMTNSYKNTVVISNTTNSVVVNKLTGLPFKYSLQVTTGDGKSTDAVVVIGKDYIGK